MAQENREIIAAVLAAGIIGSSGAGHAKGHVIGDANTAVDLYQHCLEALDRKADQAAN